MTDKTILSEVLQLVDDWDLLTCLESSKFLAEIIGNEQFWMIRIERRFPWFFENCLEDKGYRDFYMRLMNFFTGNPYQEIRDETCSDRICLDQKLIRKLLQDVIRLGHLSIVRYLIEKIGVDPHQDGELSLKWASMWGHFPVVRYLVETCDCDPHVDNEGALRWAVEQEDVQLTKYFIEDCGCDPHVSNDWILRIGKVFKLTQILEYLESLKGN